MRISFNSDTRHIQLLAVYFDDLIDLKAFRSRHSHLPVLATDPLIVEFVRGQYAVLTKFGSVVFWGADRAHVDELCAAVAAMPGGNKKNDQVQDTLEVHVEPGEPTELGTSFSEVRVPELTLVRLRVISIALGQSVALEHFELEVHRAIKEVQPRIDALAARGRLSGKERDVLRGVGFVLAVRSQVLANLTLFDKPPEAWESEAIDRLDNLLYDHFDLEERLSAITQKVEFLSELNTTFLEILTHRKSFRVEWIVVGLILFEVVMGLWEMARGH